MTYVFGKLVWSVLRPSNFLLLLAVIGVLGLGRRRRWAVRLVTTSVLVMLVCTLLPVGMWLSLPLENRFPRPPADLEPVTDALMVAFEP